MATSSTAPSRRREKHDTAALEHDSRAAKRLVMELMAIPGASGAEGKVAQRIVQALKQAGAPRDAISFDDAHRKTPLKGETGNLILRLPGTERAPRRLLMAHMDTVPLCVGAKPVARGAEVRSQDKSTGLGGDDRSGCAVILTAATEILRRKLPHPPLTFLWAIQEEVGLFGARYVALSELGKPKLAFNWDGGQAGKIVVGATGAYRMTIEIDGIASHAGAAPEQGVNALTIAGVAIAELHREGWLGLVNQNGRLGTSNIGMIEGGLATNVVTPRVKLQAEARSHDREFRVEIVNAIESAFVRASKEVKNGAGTTGIVQCSRRLDYESFELPSDAAAATAAEAAARSVGLTPLRAISNGGLDANWMTARGIPTVTLGCGQQNIHTTNETLDLEQFDIACRMALRLATATENAA